MRPTSFGRRGAAVKERLAVEVQTHVDRDLGIVGRQIERVAEHRPHPRYGGRRGTAERYSHQVRELRVVELRELIFAKGERRFEPRKESVYGCRLHRIR